MSKILDQAKEVINDFVQQEKSSGQNNSTIVYDITLQSGQQIKGCYFVEYRKPVKSGFGCVLAYVNDCVKCFNQYDEEVQGVCLNGATINKIYDIHTGEDYTDILLTEIAKVEQKLGYAICFPYVRKIVILS